jgi:RNA ligase
VEEAEILPQKKFKDNDILELREKVDGSLAVPIVVNGKVVMRTKNTAFSVYSVYMHYVLNNNPQIEKAILWANKNGIQLIFEFISPELPIVVNYHEPKLVLIQARDKSSGIYLKYSELKSIADKFEIEIAAIYHISFKELMEKLKNEKGIEGYVYNDPNPLTFYKFKTKWYMERHSINAPNQLKENNIIEYVIYNKIDDVLAIINNDIKKKKVIKIADKVRNYKYRVKQEVLSVLAKEKKLSVKEMAIKYKEHHLFPFIIKAKTGSDVDKEIDKFILKSTNKLNKAIKFINEI